MTWLLSGAPSFISIFFYALGFAIPLCFRLSLLFSGDRSIRQLSVGSLAILVARDATAAGFLCGVARLAAIAAPVATHVVLATIFMLAVALSCVDVMLLGEIGTRVELEILGYAAELNVIGKTRWRKPAYVTAGVLGASSGLGWWGQDIMAPAPHWALVALGALFVPLFVWGPSDNKEFRWRADGALWRWMRIAWQGSRRKTARRTAHEGPAAACISAGEQYSCPNPSYPLWRDTRFWGSPRALSWSMPKGSKPHVIYVVMESMGAQDTGCIGGAFGQTPCFDAWSTKGHLFGRHYASGHSTSRSMMSALYGVLPGHRSRPTLIGEHPAYLHGLPQIFAEQGYRTCYMQGAPLFFDDKEPFYQRRGFAQVTGADYLMQQYPDAEIGAWDAPHDVYLFDAHMAWLKKQQREHQLTFSTLLTISNHAPWEVPQAWRWQDIQNEADYRARIVSGDPDEARKRRETTLRYADAQLGIYLEKLEAEGILDEAIVIISGDTGQQYEAGQVDTQVGGYLRDVAYHIPLLILAPRFLGEAKRIDSLSSQIDLVPTILDMLGLAGPHHSMGQSLLRMPQRQAVHFTQPHQPSCFSLRQDTWRFNVGADGSWTSLYDVLLDPDETRNVAAAHPELIQAYKRQVVALQEAAISLHQQDAFCPPPDADSAVRRTQLAQAVRIFAPAGLAMPQSLEALQAIIDNPTYAQDATMQRYQTLAARVLRAPLTPEQHLTLLQIRLQQIYPDSFGELRWFDESLFINLYNDFVAAERDQKAALLAQVEDALLRAKKFKL